jgi:phosphoglycerate-specific signal transduction histidine kinase
MNELQPLNLVRPSERMSKVRKASVQRLDDLGFDPISELVKTYEMLKLEVQRQEDIRDGRVVELTTKGTPKAYYAETHHALYDKMIKVGESLLRYKYGRVPEVSLEQERPHSQLIINLTGQAPITQEVSDGGDAGSATKSGVLGHLHQEETKVLGGELLSGMG